MRHPDQTGQGLAPHLNPKIVMKCTPFDMITPLGIMRAPVMALLKHVAVILEVFHSFRVLNCALIMPSPFEKVQFEAQYFRMLDWNF